MSFCRRRSPPPTGMYGSSPPRSRSPNSIDDLRSEFNKISQQTEEPSLMRTLSSIKPEEATWEKYGAQVQDFLEKKANDPSREMEPRPRFPGNFRRRWNPQDKPLWINGSIVPQKDALMIEMVLNNKSSLKAQLDMCKQPIVGLDFVTEYIDPEGENPRIYFCSLCNQYNTIATVLEHITGYNHRVRYIGKGYPNQARTYLLPDGRHANRSRALLKMAAGRCSELELVYGRGDYVVKRERPSIPEGKLDAEEGDVIIQDGEQTIALKKVQKVVKQCKLESDEDVRLAKQIINDLTDLIIVFKQSSADEKMNRGISNLLSQGRHSLAAETSSSDRMM